MNGYEDIINLSYPRCTKRPRMSMSDRAAQFSPFAALTGYDAAIQETGRQTQAFVVLGPDGLSMLDEKLQKLFQRQQENPKVTVNYFIPDKRKIGGSYKTLTGNIKHISQEGQLILMEDGTEIAFDKIYDISADMFI